MQSNNIENVRKEQLSQIMSFLHWKLEHNSKDINEGKIANYLKISMEEAMEILLKLYDMHAIVIETKVNCPKCQNDLRVENIDSLVECNSCEYKFYPKQNEKYIHYYYRINEFYKEFKVTKEKPKLSIVTKFSQGDSCNMSGKKVNVFLSYCHVDEEYKDKLDVHLSPLKRCDKINTWNDRKLLAGTQLDDEIKKHLEKADVIILLISADFMSSDYCYDIEMKKAMERCKNGQCKMISVIVRPCLWDVTPLKDFLALPKDGKPINTYENEDVAYLEIAKALNQVIDDM